MVRLIDADALPVRKAHCVDEAGWGADFCVVDKSDIDNAPTIEAEPVKHGRWKKHKIMHGFVYCNACRDVYLDKEWLADGKWTYCPNCGAKMDLEATDDEVS